MTELKPCPFCGREAEIIAETKRNIGFTIWCECKECSARKFMSRDDYAFPCAGCLCDHCANNLYSSDQMAGEAKIFCYVCEECRYYDGNLKNKDMRCKQCENYIVTNEHAERLRKKIKVVKK